jgi:hypothetical protein
MKRYIKFLLISVFFLPGCSGFIDVNQNPNNPETVPSSTLLSTVLITSGFTSGNDLGRITSLFVQHMAGTGNQMATYDVYVIRGASDNQWSGELYGGLLINCQRLIDQTQQNSPRYAGIAKILKAYGFSVTTDLFGDVPYSQALKSTSQSDSVADRPRFDMQRDIYLGNQSLGIQSLFDLVREGMADLDKPNPGPSPSGDDVVFSGNIAQWKRVGNTLLLKFALTVSDRDPDLARRVINEVLTSPAGFINQNSSATTTNELEIPFGRDQGQQNPIYSFNFVNRPGDQMLSQRLRDTMQVLRDPRLSRFFTAPTDRVAPVDTFTVWNNGNGGTIPPLANRSKYGTYFTGAASATLGTSTNNPGGSAPIRILTNAQRCFILAEAALVLGTPGDPQTLFREGIRASMEKTGLTTAEVTTYFNANPTIITLTGSVEQRRNQILTQKWIANVGNGIEAYNDWRRTGYPRLVVALNAQGDNNQIPLRFPYPSIEISRNPNTPNPGPLTSVPVWWDVK